MQLLSRCIGLICLCRNILCFPISDNNDVIGVAELCNKQSGSHFTKFDEEMATAFSSYCGLAILHSLMYKKVADAQYRSKLSNELMMYHMKVCATTGFTLHIIAEANLVVTRHHEVICHLNLRFGLDCATEPSLTPALYDFLLRYRTRKWPNLCQAQYNRSGRPSLTSPASPSCRG